MGSIPIPPLVDLTINQKGIYIFNLYSKNVQYLRKVINLLNKDINNSIKISNEFQLNMQTKLLALTYSAWSEAQFSQIIYTPNSFLQTEIDEILRVKKSGITEGWKRLIKISISKVIAPNEEKRKKQRELNDYLDKYIFKQSQMRNKIAHGQWVNTIEDTEEKTIDFNQRLSALNVVDIMIEFQVHTTLGKIIRDLVQSPNKGFSLNYNKNITDLTDYLIKSNSWNMNSKKIQLSKKQNKIFCKNCNGLQ